MNKTFRGTKTLEIEESHNETRSRKKIENDLLLAQHKKV